MRKIIALVAVMAMLGLASTASATTFDITFTADNIITDLTLAEYGGSASTVSGFGALSNLTNWRSADTISVDLTSNYSYQLVWRVENDGATSTGNPFAFLASVSAPGADDILSSASWEVALEDGSGAAYGWTSANTYAYNSGQYVDGSGTSVWYNALGSSVSGISDDALWIGLDEFPGAANGVMYVRATFVAPETPIPAAAWLMGSGLFGLLGMRRLRRS